jgi:hypothetical protein
MTALPALPATGSYRDLEVADWGMDDVDTLMVAGHVPARIALAAANHHARTAWGYSSLSGGMDGDMGFDVLEPVSYLYIGPCDRLDCDNVDPDHEHIYPAPGPGHLPYTAVHLW